MKTCQLTRRPFFTFMLFLFLSNYAKSETNLPAVVTTNDLAAVPVSSLSETNLSAVVTTNNLVAVPVSSLKVERAAFVVEGSGGQGSGFLMQESGQVFFVSNVHVLGGGTNFSIKNVYGETISIPDVVQVASDRDLIRFPVDYPGGLRVAQEYEFGDALCAIGNSGGAGVITRIDGTIMALGPKLVEVSCTFIPGNSGGPILDKKNQVVGVSTYLTSEKDMPEWIIKGSRFTETRRMAVRVDNVSWISMSWGDFCKEYSYVDRYEEYSNEIIHIIESLSGKSTEVIYSDSGHADIQGWIKSYNQYVRSSGSRLDREVQGTSVIYKVSTSMRASYKKKLVGLSGLMDVLRKEIKMNAVTTPYFKEQLEKSSDYLERSQQQMESVVEIVL